MCPLCWQWPRRSGGITIRARTAQLMCAHGTLLYTAPTRDQSAIGSDSTENTANKREDVRLVTETAVYIKQETLI